MKILKYFITLIIKIHLIVTNEALNFVLIVDFLQSYEQPSLVSAFLCNKKVELQLIQHLNRNKFLANSFNPTFQNWLQFNAPHTVFLTEISNCHDSINFLQKYNCSKSAEKIVFESRSNTSKSAFASLKLASLNKDTSVHPDIFNYPYRWIIYSSSNDTIEIQEKNFQEHFQDINILVDSEVTAIFSDNSTYSLFQFYKIAPNLPIIKEPFGVWRKNHGLNITQKIRIIATRRQNLEQVVLKTVNVITDNDTFHHLTDYRNPTIDAVTKMNYILVRHVSDFINATLSYSYEGTWGYKDKNGSWSGLIGRLVRKEAIIGGTPAFMTAERVGIIDYIALTTRSRSKFVFRQPKLSYVTNVYQLPFHWTVWVSTVGLILLGTIALLVAIKWENRRSEFLKQEVELHGTWHEALFIIFGATCQQGAPSLPDGISGRIISIFLFLSLMFLYTSYSANIVSLLQSPAETINTLSDLLHSRLGLGIHNTVFNRYYFTTATEPVRKAIYEKVSSNNQLSKFMELSEGIAKLREGLFAFHFEEGIGYRYIQDTFLEHEKCGLKDIQYLQVVDPHITVQKNTPYKKVLKLGFRRIHENGIQQREFQRIYTKQPKCESQSGGFISVGLIDCYMVVVILLGGIVLSLIIFGLEIYIHYRMTSFKEGKSLLKKLTKNK